ncbi:MAG: hypothetical protein RLY82_1767 [Pseudomonadota bacterium]|jgi:polyhydroxyalkanoate synthase
MNDQMHEQLKKQMEAFNKQMADWAAQAHSVGSKALSDIASQASSQPSIDEKTKAKLAFSVEQMISATNPKNFFAFNPEAIQKAIDSKGESIQQGITNLLGDMKKGSISMTDESAFEVGKNVGTSEGAVVFENELFQLIEYKPLTAKVFEKPFLLIPPCINKFYILDLQPENSFIRYTVEQGHRTFVVSWRNPELGDARMAAMTWDDYIEDAAIKAISVVQEICQAKQINALGFCVGGTILATALAVLAARDESPVASATFLTTLMDFTNTGVLDVFIDENFVKLRESQFASGGILKGQELATTFSFLRPNDLVWNYVASNYLMGNSPPPFDLLYWNGDATNLPGPMYAWYLRQAYLENNLAKSKYCVVADERVDFEAIDIPCYIYGSKEDHIVPIEGAYASTQLLSGKKRFVMGASGHIAGVINPPVKKKRSHWTRDDGKLPSTQAKWLEGATEHAGSWWDDWAHWLKPLAGKTIASPKLYGRAKFKPIEAAPGRYVKVKAST